MPDLQSSLTEDDHLILIDGSSYIFRAYHALPPLTRKKDGLPVGAVSGFCNMLWKLLQDAKDNASDIHATHLAVIFDASSQTFRNEIYDGYKAHRPEPPEDLRPQFGLIKRAVEAFGLPMIEQVGFEADDLIATYAHLAGEKGARVTMVASDKDLMQLVTDKVAMYDTMKDKHIGPDQVVEKFGVMPDRVVDVQALAGDSVDNVPGVPGIGVKTAAQLINEFGDLESLLTRAGEIKQNKRRENLIEFAQMARISRQLVELRHDVPIKDPVDDFALFETDGPPLIAFLKAMGFTTLTKRVAEATEADADAIEEIEVPFEHWTVKVSSDEASGDANAAPAGAGHTPEAHAEKVGQEIAALAIETAGYETIHDVDTLKRWVSAARQLGHVALDTETNSLDAMQADLVGFSLALAPGKACYVPLLHRSGTDDLLGGGVEPDQIPMSEAKAILRDLCEDNSILKIGQNFKFDMLVLAQHGISISNYDDTMLMSYALDGGRGGNGMDELSARWLDHKPISFKEIAGTGKNALTFDQIPIAQASIYAAEDADITLRLWIHLKPRLVPETMTSVYERLERPMASVLCAMERRGITVDRQILSRLSGDMAQSMAGLEAEIHDLAGENFNIASPKQLGEILFEKMSIEGSKKTKTGAWATGADILEELASRGLDLPQKVLEWRQLSKLKSTYTDALPSFIHPETKRVHTSYALAATTTGRLSSSDPNLQNIPIRTEAGRKIRTAFVATPGNKLISADYSQIELRVLAHVGEVDQLRRAFDEGLDIHAMTASEMFNTPIEGMDPMVRRRAKAINFGIIYGISAFGLANQLGINRSEAKDYIDTYFERFPGIRDYMEETKAFAHANGYVETIFGRKAHYPDINTKNPNMRAFNERAAINAPIQGSAADIIRRAMIRMDKRLEQSGLSAQMLLQVHDELIFEAPEAEVDQTIDLVTNVMEEASLPTVQLSVPLKVDARAANNWDEAH